jgi:hypothetical protein
MDGSTNHPDRGSKADHALTSDLDHLMGAGQFCRQRFSPGAFLFVDIGQVNENRWP